MEWISPTEFKSDAVMNAVLTPDKTEEVAEGELILTDKEFRTFAYSELRRIRHWMTEAMEGMPGRGEPRKLILCASIQCEDIMWVAEGRKRNEKSE